jgi:hypothetical protein
MCHDNEKALAEKNKEREKLDFYLNENFSFKFYDSEAYPHVDTATKYMVLRLRLDMYCMYKEALPVPVQAFRPY